MSIYPDRISRRFLLPANRGVTGANSEGTSASFVCGCFVSLSLRIREDEGVIEDTGFRTNGCGYMIAAADVLSEYFRTKTLADLHGLRNKDLMDLVVAALNDFPPERVQCAEIVFDALREAMASYRLHRIEEFQGEKAIICTCFGVSEETIEAFVADNNPTDVDQVADGCRAGSGCGSCRMLVQELIDAHVEAV